VLSSGKDVPQGVDGDRWQNVQGVQTNFTVIRLFLRDFIDGIEEDGNLFVNILDHFLFAKAKVAQVAKSKAPLGFPLLTLSEENACNFYAFLSMRSF
jgi:hypothetical protein